MKPIAVFETHSWFVYTAAFSPDQKTLAAGTRENAGFSLIDTKTWSVRHLLADVHSPPHGVAFSPDSRSLVISCGKESPLTCWDPMAGTLRWAFKPGSMDVVFSPDGRTLAATRGKDVLLCDAANGKLRQLLKGHSSRVDRVVFAADGTRLATMAGGQVLLWDGRNGSLVTILQQKQGDVGHVCFSPDGKLLVVGGAKGAVRFYDGASGKPLAGCEGHEDMVWDAAFTPDGKNLVTIEWGGGSAIIIWDVAPRRAVHYIQDACGASIELSPDGKLVACLAAGGGIGLWRVDTGALAAKIPVDGGTGVDTALPFSPDGKWLAATCDDAKTRVWDLGKLQS